MSDAEPNTPSSDDLNDAELDSEHRNSAPRKPQPDVHWWTRRRLSHTVTAIDKVIPVKLTTQQLATWSGIAFCGAVLAVILRWIVGATYLQPAQGTVLGGVGVLAAGALTYYAAHRTRVSNENIARETNRMAESELELERDKLQTTSKREDEHSARTHRRELERDLRTRFSSSAAQLADHSPTIRLAGVYSLIALADDWDDAGNLQQRNVCVEVLKAYLTQPQVDPSPAEEQALPFLQVRRRIALTLYARHAMKKSETHSWNGLSAALLDEADLRYVDLTNVNLRGANLSSAKLSNTNLFAANLSEANLDFADLPAANLAWARMLNTSLEYAKLGGADLGHANLTKATLESADLKGARLDSASLKEAKLNYADLEGADFESADLAGAIFKECSYDDTTTWPDGTHSPPPEITLGRAPTHR